MHSIVLGNGKYYMAITIDINEELLGITICRDKVFAGDIIDITKSECTILFSNTQSLDNMIDMLSNIRSKMGE